MALYCLPTEPYIDSQFPNNRKWVVITKDYPKPTPDKGKRKASKEVTQKYNEMVADRKKMFEQLESGHYNCFNQPTQGVDILSCASDILSDRNYIYYRIKPIGCKVTSERYSYSTKDYPISEFDVINKCDTKEKLLLQLDKDGCLDEFLARAFDSGHYKNNQESYIKVLSFCKENTKDFNFCLGNIVAKNNHEYDRVPRYGTDKYDLVIETFAKELISDGLMLLHSCLDFYEKQTFTFLLRMHWFDLALDYISTMEKKNYDPFREVIIADKGFKDIERILKTNNDKESVKKIIVMLDFKPSTLTLKVFPYVEKWDDFDESEEPTDVKEFENMDDVRSYLISEYKVPFSELVGDISDFEYCPEEYERTHFVVE